VVILGGGFAGVYTAMHLERLARRRPLDVTLVSRENYLTFQPMLAEVVSGNVGLLDTISPLRRLLPRTGVVVRELEGIDLDARRVALSPGVGGRPHVLTYDRLVVALGSVTDFRGLPGLPEHALPFKTLADAVILRSHVLQALEQAAIEEDPQLRRRLLTYVVAGGGFSGTEAAAAVNDVVRRASRHYPSIPSGEVRVVLVHSGPAVLDREVSEELSRYSTELLRRRGVEVLLDARLVAASRDAAVLDDGRAIPTGTLVSTVPSSPNPLVEALDVPKDQGRMRCDAGLQVVGHDDLWAVGDCASVPAPTETGFSPPTAQHAVRQARVAAANVVASLRGGRRASFGFSGLGKMGSLGHRRAVAELPGGVRLSGLPAWLLWRSVYWSKLPGADRKLRVAASWLTDVLVPPELVQLNLGAPRAVAQARFEPGDVVFREGDVGDRLYMILSGEAEIVREAGDREQVVARLGAGECFGEMALLSGETRNATARACSVLEVLSLHKRDLGPLLGGLPELRAGFEAMAARRSEPGEAPDAR
jgi:NADH dehydrogenase